MRSEEAQQCPAAFRVGCRGRMLRICSTERHSNGVIIFRVWLIQVNRQISTIQVISTGEDLVIGSHKPPGLNTMYLLYKHFRRRLSFIY